LGNWTFRSQDHSLPGAKVPGVELSLSGTFQVNGGWSESMQPGARVPAMELLLPLVNRARNGSVVNCN